MYNNKKTYKIYKYIDLINGFLNNVNFFEINCKLPTHDIRKEIHRQFLLIEDKEEFIVAIFIMRNTFRLLMNTIDTNADYNTIIFKVFNFLFFELLNVKNKTNILLSYHQERKKIEDIIKLANVIIERECSYKDNSLTENAINIYLEKLSQVSSLIGDQHSYSLKNRALSTYLKSRGLERSQIQSQSIEILKNNGFITVEEIENSLDYKMLCNFNYSYSKDDTIIIDNMKINQLSNRFQNFINTFESGMCKNSMDSESDLIFAFKDSTHIYISKYCMNKTQLIIQDFYTWGQYENLIKYYYPKIKRNESILNKYNKLMTYKISDLLLSHNYILPMEIVKLDGTKYKVPRVEIKSIEKKIPNELGDFDLLFFSEKSNTIYLVEYKNFQMFVSGNNDIKADINKVERENTISKVIIRKKYVEQHITQIINKLFGGKMDNPKIKAVIITTKPCLYFIQNKFDSLIYMDWIDFKHKVENQEL